MDQDSQSLGVSILKGRLARSAKEMHNLIFHRQQHTQFQLKVTLLDHNSEKEYRFNEHIALSPN
ncbi:hypothetical protein [Halalkalibacter hemicellulosilyticus]|uniref:Uncharacterized protein n=1 Tax=Halalkalibacter hemicellulosilyticusJCM 9152 TaxID=1236971 RepID=W4QG30_9BACI|nr:hypothetical protein [Halalkalibacter hemicellulosilyticus]GAE31050.1 hypothetical protein JCM9152_2488 [Halalkalibacter hemicellulosilyticusJCM 9152]